MAKTTQSSARSTQHEKVWRIFRFGERYELPEDMRACRKSGLQYTRDFVSAAGGDEAVGYINQFKLLDGGDGIELMMLKGLYRELINMAAAHSKAKRGYLIDADDRPLSDTQIGKMVNIKGPTMSRLLRQYADVKLVEKVDMPVFDFTINEFPAKKKDVLRKNPEKSGKIQRPLKNGKREKEKRKVNEQKATNGLTAVKGNRKENGNTQRKVSAKGKGQGQGEPPSAPTTAPEPFEPHGSDDPGGTHVIPFTAPRTSLRPPDGRQRRYAGSYERSYDRSDVLFGTRVYVVLGFRGEVGSAAARREIRSFASKWHEVRDKLARLPPEVVDGLGVRLVDEARKIGKRGTKNRKRGAVWNDVADKMVNARLREAM